MEFFIVNQKTIYAHDNYTNLDFIFDKNENKWKLLSYSLNFIPDEFVIKITKHEVSHFVDIKPLEQLIKTIKNI